MTPLIPLLASTLALLGSLALVFAGTLIIMRRTQSSSLFMEDQMGFIVAKLVAGTILIVIGVAFTTSAMERLLALS